MVAGKDDAPLLKRKAQVIGRVPRRVQRQELRTVPLDAVAVRDADVRCVAGVDVLGGGLSAALAALDETRGNP